jgi:hypothetical protein
VPFLLHYEWEQDTDRGSAGWSENFWYGQSDLPGALAVWNNLAPYLAAVHSNEARLRGGSVRAVSNQPEAKIPRLFTPVDYYDSGHFLGLRYTGMFPTTAAQLTLRDVEGRSNHVWLKGMPDGIDVGGQIGILPVWQLKMNALLAFIQAPVNGIVRRHLDFTQPQKPIDGITATGVVTCVAHGFPDQAFVRIGKTTSTPNIDGIYRIKLISGSADTFQLLHFPPVAAAPATSRASYAQRQQYTTVSVTTAVWGGISKKNCGRPRRGLRGRQTTPRN